VKVRELLADPEAEAILAVHDDKGRLLMASLDGVRMATYSDRPVCQLFERRQVLTINEGTPAERTVEIPEGAIAWKLADPTEEARWVFEEHEERAIRREDPGLLEYVDDVPRD
jgi:hypothetical protein